MARQVKVNLELLQSTWSTYNEAITSLKETLTKVENAISILRLGGWKSEGADAFFAAYDNEYKNDIKKHISYLEHLRDCLQNAKTEFTSQYEQKLK